VALRLVRELGITRHGGEAVATQWVNNDARKAAQAVRFAATRPTVHWAQGHTKHTHAGVAVTAAKLAERQWLTNPNVVRSAAASRTRTFVAEPSRHYQSRVTMSATESLVAEWLTFTGRDYVYQHPITCDGRFYFADFFLPGSNILIEPTLKYTSVTPIRLATFRHLGYIPLAIFNRYVAESAGLNHLQEQVSRAESGQLNPTTVGECWVRRRPRQNTAAYRDMNQRLDALVSSCDLAQSA
jgi:hypothetical protein